MRLRFIHPIEFASLSCLYFIPTMLLNLMKDKKIVQINMTAIKYYYNPKIATDTKHFFFFLIFEIHYYFNVAIDT